MAEKAYSGGIDTKFVRIGGQRLLLAPLTADDISEKIDDITIPPTGGWRNCGSLFLGSADLTSEREIFTLFDGLPEMPKYQEVVGIKGDFKCSLNEWSFPNIWEALGRPPIKHTLDAAGSGTLQENSDRDTLVLDTDEGEDFAVDDMVVVSAEADKLTSENVGAVLSIAGDTLTLSQFLSNVPETGWKVNRVVASKVGIGDTSIIPLKAAVVFDSKDGTQIVHMLKKCAMIGAYNPGLNKHKEQVVLPLQFTAYGVYDSDLDTTVIVNALIFHKNQAA